MLKWHLKNCNIDKKFIPKDMWILISLIDVTSKKQAYMAYKSRLNIKLKFIE